MKKKKIKIKESRNICYRLTLFYRQDVKEKSG